ATPSTPAALDHEVVRRLRGAGAIIIGKTRVPEFCAWAWTDGAGGVTRNPWDVTVTAGGSSGGAAAAVAARMVPLAQGSDADGAAVRRVSELLAGLGHDVSESDPPYGALMLNAAARVFAGVAVDASDLPSSTLEPRSRTEARLGRLVLRFGLVRESGRARWR